MIRQERSGVPFLQFDTFSKAALTSSVPLVHAVSTRLGGVSAGAFSSLNLGHTVGDRPDNVRTNHDRFYQALGIGAAQVVTAHQVHGHVVQPVGAFDSGRVVPATDALVTDESGVYLMLRFADCVPVLFYAPDVPAVGIAHAGWRGTVAGIAAETARAMQREYGCPPGEILVGIGPAIGPCCYQVGAEVIEAAESVASNLDGLISWPEGGARPHLDLAGLNAKLLHRAGVQHIEIANVCTACHTDTFYSHRAERGNTGRLAAIIGLA